MLGLPADATVHQLTRAISEASDRLVQNLEIQRLRAIFGNLEEMLIKANEKLPGETAKETHHG